MSEESLLPLAPLRAQAVSRNGKRVTCSPVVQHGLASTDRVYISIMERPERSMFGHIRSQLLKELAPEGILQKMLAEHLAVSHFRLLRVFAMDHMMTTKIIRQSHASGAPYITRDDLQRLSMLASYERQIERTFRLSLQKLEQMKATPAPLNPPVEEVRKSEAQNPSQTLIPV